MLSVLSAALLYAETNDWTDIYKGKMIRFIRLEYSGKDWDDGMDAKSGADINFLQRFGKMTGAKVAKTGDSHPISALKRYPRDAAPPLLYITGSESMGRIGKYDVDILRDYLTGGGTLFADCAGPRWHGRFLHLTMRLFPDSRLRRIAHDDPLFQQPFTFPNGAPPLWHHGGYHVQGVRHEGRWAIIYHPGDINDAWKTGHSGINAELAKKAFQFGANVVHYAWKHAPGPRRDFVPRKLDVSDVTPPKLKEWLASVEAKHTTMALPDGTFSLIVKGGPKMRDFSPLAGIPVQALTIHRAPAADLSPLATLPLDTLNLGSCPMVKDLTPLRNTEIRSLRLSDLPRADLTSLAGMRLDSLHLAQMRAEAVTMAARVKTRSLGLSAMPAESLARLRGMNITELSISDMALRNLTPIQGLPLKKLSLVHVRVNDFSAFARMRLESIRIYPPSRVAEAARVLQNMKSLKQINFLPAAEFWKRHDAARAPKSKPRERGGG